MIGSVKSKDATVTMNSVLVSFLSLRLATSWWGWLPQTILIAIDEYETTITKRQNKITEYCKKPKMCSSKSSKTKLVEMSPAVIQTIATAAPKIFFFIRRCLNGRNVACVRSKEIAARLIIDAVSKTLHRTFITTTNGMLKWLIVQSLQYIPKVQQSMETLAPANISATAWLITRYMLRLRRLRSFR